MRRSAHTVASALNLRRRVSSGRGTPIYFFGARGRRRRASTPPTPYAGCGERGCRRVIRYTRRAFCLSCRKGAPFWVSPKKIWRAVALAPSHRVSNVGCLSSIIRYIEKRSAPEARVSGLSRTRDVPRRKKRRRPAPPGPLHNPSPRWWFRPRVRSRSSCHSARCSTRYRVDRCATRSMR